MAITMLVLSTIQNIKFVRFLGMVGKPSRNWSKRTVHMFSMRNSLQETQLSDLWDVRNLQLGWNYLTTISQFQSKKPWVYFHFFCSFCGTSLLGRYFSTFPDTFLIVAWVHKTSPLGNLHEATGCSSQWCSWKQRNKIQYRWSHVISVSNCSMGSQSGNSFLHKVRPCVSS